MSNKTTNDLAFINGKVITVDNHFSIKQAIAIRDNKILAVGSNEDIKSLINQTTEVIDLKKRTILPGINDSHIHHALWAGTKPPLVLDLNYPAVKSIEDIVRLVENMAKTAKPGEWIRGVGWDEGFLVECLADKSRHPAKSDLDSVSPSNPVALNDFSLHTLWVNSKALELADVDKNSSNPAGGEIVKDPHTGEPTGLFKEFSAEGLVMRVIPPWTKEQKKKAIVAGINELNSLGITSITEPALGPGGDTFQGGLLGAECIAAYNELYDDGELNARVNILYLFGEYGANSYKDLKAILPALGFHRDFGNEMLKIGGIKIFADGIPPIKTAWMSEDYVGGGRGGLVLPGDTDRERADEMDKMISCAHEYGFQVGVHAIGDLAIGAAISSFIKTEKKSPKGLRHYVLHVDFMTSEQAKLAGKHNIGVCCQPALLWTLSDSLIEIVGLKKVKEEWPYKMIIDAGVHLSGSSDAPCSYPSWLQGIQSAVLRESKASGKIYSPDQCVTKEQALRMYTMESAWQDNQEKIKGSIEPGKLADLCVLDEDILEVDAHEIKDIRNVMTVVNGKIVFSKGF